MSIRPYLTVKTLRTIITSIPKAFKVTYLFVGFFILLILFMIGKVIHLLSRIPLFGKLVLLVEKIIWDGKLERLYTVVFNRIESVRSTEVKRSYIIHLAFNNLITKKNRTIVTILGMSFGIGIIVLLLSLGYGIEKLVITKVASLDELKMIDVSGGENTALRLNQDLVTKIQAIKDVEKVIPLISIVGKVNYNKANTDIIVYAASKDYMDFSKIKLAKGNLFAINEEKHHRPYGDVAGAQDDVVDGVYDTTITGSMLTFNILPEVAAKVSKSCSIDSELIGYTVRMEGGNFQGVEYWGGTYAPFQDFGRVGYDSRKQQYLGKWVKATVPLYQKTLDEKLEPVINDSGHQKWEDGCLEEHDLQLDHSMPFGKVTSVASSSGTRKDSIATKSAELRSPNVLGESTDSAQLAEGDVEATESSLFETTTTGSSGGMEIVELIASSSATKKTSPLLPFTQPPSGEAIVSAATLGLLNIPMDKAIGTKFKVSFIVTKSLKPDIEGRGTTSEVEYTIKGVTDDADTTYIYIPISDIQNLGATNFSQVKVILADKGAVLGARKAIDTLGFRTASTIDTVNQIEGLFANLRVVLGLIGLVALGVASLGMFNTLTVSLLERTREIGGMKTMGMVSNEVQDLFLAEAMIMGLTGGIGGLFLGYAIGHFLSFAISLFAITQGQGYLNLTSIPLFLTIFILLSSFVVGVITGLYPAQRAKKISALNALRYE